MVIKVRCQTGALIAHRTADTSYKNNNVRLQRRSRRCPSKGLVEINCKVTIPQYIMAVTIGKQTGKSLKNGLLNAPKKSNTISKNRFYNLFILLHRFFCQKRGSFHAACKTNPTAKEIPGKQKRRTPRFLRSGVFAFSALLREQL